MQGREQVELPRLMLAGTQSGVGKTTLSTGLIAAWHKQGRCVQAFKAGPDYIDRTYLELASGRPGRNLDSWLIPAGSLRALFLRAALDADVAVVEGVMGLFDGYAYRDDAGSSAEVARLLRLPVVLVLDARAAARSVAATALGFVRFAPDLMWSGVIINRVAGRAHGEGVAQAVRWATGLPVFGWVPKLAALSVPERHLGLVPTVEPGSWQRFVEAAADAVSRHLDLDGLWQAAARAPALAWEIRGSGQPAKCSAGQVARRCTVPAGPEAMAIETAGAAAGARPVIAVANDAAFSFHYPENLELLQQAGAELRFFRPGEGEAVPPEADGLVLSGGFPELYASRLAANRSFLDGLRALFRAHRPIYAECGGLMVLTEAIVVDGERHPMAGVLPGEAVMVRRVKMGYRQAEAATDSWLLYRGESVRGHEFHYSEWAGRPPDLPPALQWRDGDGNVRRDGAAVGGLWASYVHLNFLSWPALARRFLRACLDAREDQLQRTGF